MATDIKALIDCLELVEQTGVVMKQVLVDGKVDFRDIPKLFALWSPAKLAISELKDIPAEVQDLDAAEVQVLIEKVMEVATTWVGVFTPAA